MSGAYLTLACYCTCASRIYFSGNNHDNVSRYAKRHPRRDS